MSIESGDPIEFWNRPSETDSKRLRAALHKAANELEAAACPYAAAQARAAADLVEE